MNLSKRYLAAIILSIALISSCKQTPIYRTTCTSTLYGYIGANLGSNGACTFGILNPSAGTISSVASFIATSGTTDGTFNTVDSCYYVVKQTPGYFSDTLLRIAPNGTVTQLSHTGTDSIPIRTLIYNQLNHKLYGSKNPGLAEITVTPTTFSTTMVSDSAEIGTVDNALGNIYFIASTNYSAASLKKYNPISATLTTVASYSFANGKIVGLQFNKNDNMLYAVQFNKATPSGFIKINPATGAITSLAPATYNVSTGYYASAIDPCTNHYIFASLSMVTELSMTGDLIHQNFITGAMAQALAIKNW